MKLIDNYMFGGYKHGKKQKSILQIYYFLKLFTVISKKIV